MLPLKHAREASRFLGKFESVLASILLVCALSGCAAGRPSANENERVVIIPREIDEIDPRYVGDAYGLKLSRLVYASLVTIDPMTLEPSLDLAQSIENDGPLTYVVRLRPGLRFSDGSSLDATDVVATFQALLDPRVNSRYRSSYARLKRVRALDALTVELELSESHATFITDLEMPVLRSEDAFAARDKAKVPRGAGPFVLVHRNASGLKLAPNPHYHRQSKQVPSLHFVVVRDDNVRALRMLAGAGDLAQNVLPPLLLPLFEGRRDLRIIARPGSGTTYIGINLSQPVLADVRVRAAIAHAVDRQQLIQHKLGGRARLASSWIPPGHWAHDPHTASYAFMPDRARALLHAAGADQRVRLVMRTSSDRAVVSLARAIASMLDDVGIDIEVRPSESALLLSDLARGRFELTLLQVPELFEPHVLSWFFSSDRIPQPGVREGGNRFRLRSAALDRALEAGRRELDRAQRIQSYHLAQQLLALELPVIPLWHEDVVAVLSHRLATYEVPSDARFGTLAR